MTNIPTQREISLQNKITELENHCKSFADFVEKYYTPLTEEGLRKKDGYIHLKNDCSIVKTSYLEELKEQLRLCNVDQLNAEAKIAELQREIIHLLEPCRERI